ncbi:MAG: acetyl-CoA decarbonylase/synthase complex subunit delta [Acetobacteraceae bacterium]|nr:acetyl-CoA decarbonylase/synthase complex subunit delta [Acetobacteraceae bacterium]
MAVEVIRDRYTGRVGEVTLGATKDQGGTRIHTVTVGGDSTLPFLQFEGEVPHRPVIALEITDVAPEWSEPLRAELGEVWGDPAAWAKKCVECGADLVSLTLIGADPERQNRSPEDCARTVRDVLSAVGVPLIVRGCGNDEKDNQVLPAVAEAAAGENVALGTAKQDNYKTLTAACMVHKHSIIAQSPIDINICKQLNILISEMNLPLSRILIDPTTASLGFGIEYCFSIMERIRLGALQGDKMLSFPVICNLGYEAWRQKEASAPASEFPGWGEQPARGVLWEAMTAAAVLEAGAHILILRHPAALRLVRRRLDALMVPNPM